MKKSFAFNEDHISVMKRYSDNYFDLAIPDPEYGIGESSKDHNSRNTPVKQKNGSSLKIANKNYKKKSWDEKPPDEKYFSELFRVSENQIIWGANYFEQIVGNTFKPPRRKDYQEFIEQNPKGWIVWDKVNGNNDFNDCELAWTSFDEPTIIVEYMWNGMMQAVSVQYGKIQQGNKKLNEKRIHPTQKPVPIYKWILRRYANPSHKVLDTHMGSGSSRIACWDFNISEYVGCEIDKEYFKDEELRFANHSKQLKLI